MAKYKRIIRYQYYQIKMTKQNSKKIFDFAYWIKQIKDNNLMQTAITFNGAKARIEKCEFSRENGLWGIRILKLRDTNIPSRAKDKEDAKVIELEDGEYLGEDVFMLFKPENGIAMIQQNRLSLGISRIEEFLEETYNRYVSDKEKSAIQIDPIVDIDWRDKLRGSNYKCIEISFANMHRFTDIGDGKRHSLASIIEPLRKLYGVTGKVTVGLGRSYVDTLNQQEILKIVKEIGEPSNKRYIRSAKIKVKEEDDTDVEILDLFNDICSDFIEFDIDSKSGLIYSVCISKMYDKFDKREKELEKLIDYKEE